MNHARFTALSDSISGKGELYLKGAARSEKIEAWGETGPASVLASRGASPGELADDAAGGGS